ncbi:hypothetical protein Q8A67_001534 [Cirrhinus molitorella]|uniref:Uncharacterized protein n=1 Tax=Cirrhinus molitorella TaxID=172907 RepID=A0AA88QHX1_9TELE|nr:hypothetical protein Q8A67_001534 [Cirrhinus molitorella]
MRRNQYAREDWINIKWKPSTIPHTFQEDCVSCGVFVMQMAKQVVENFPNIPDCISITPSEEWMRHSRRQMANEILLASGIVLK